MRLHTLHLANFRGFEQVELVFEPDVTMIAGVNGVGKSGILRALAVLLSRALPEFTPSSSRPLSFSDEDIHYGKQALEASLSFTVADQRCHSIIQRMRGSDDGGDLWKCLWMSEQEALTYKGNFSEMLGARTLTGDLEAGRADIEQKLFALKTLSRQPMVIYFSPRRQLPGRPRTLPKLKAFEIANAYGFALQDREVELREFMHWFRVVETGASEAHQHGKAVLDKLREVVTSFVPEFHNLRIEESPSLRFVVDKNGTPLALNQLSDGERGLLAILFDITRRLSIANPGLEDPISQGAGIILIDEIELHLHPKWQRQVLRRLSRVFKNCQFVITSHSPQTLGQVRPRCLRLLDWSENSERIVLHCVSQSYGMDSNWVLQNIMGSPIRDYETEQRLGNVYDLIDQDDFAGAASAIAELEKDVGLFPELQEAKSLLDRLELLKRDETD